MYGKALSSIIFHGIVSNPYQGSQAGRIRLERLGNMAAKNAISVDVIKRLVDKLRKLKITALRAGHLGCTGERQCKTLGSFRPCSAGAHTREVGLIREQKFSCIFEIPPAEPGHFPAERSPGTGWESSISASNRRPLGKRNNPCKMEAGKKANVSLDACSLWWHVLFCRMQESKQMTETLGYGGTNSAQPRTSMRTGGHSQCAATGNSVS